MINAREVFERQNADLIKAYIVGSITQKNFIREKIWQKLFCVLRSNR